MKLKTLSKIELAFDRLNLVIIIVPILLAAILGYMLDALEWCVGELDFRRRIGNKLLRISDEVKDGTIKNQDFIKRGTAIRAYKLLKYEQQHDKERFSQTV